jgi:RHH-type transcriptional regulator, proline utilization regulon repressor / proline dehydrogenase / delta 1-pyrroline-5-carboxylate dehydrogenase
MNEPKIAVPQPFSLPPRAAVSERLLEPEAPLVESLIEQARFSADELRRIDPIARELVEAARAGRHRSGGVDSFLHEYDLSSQEGVALLCLAEALLRIPDRATADRLIADTIPGGDWEAHLGQSDSLFVNASTFGLVLTGRVLDWSGGEGTDIGQTLRRLVARSGEPVIRQALRQAMRILGKQFVLGQDIGEALGESKAYERQGYRFSYDMLGEAARTAADAERYYRRYADALEAIAASAAAPQTRNDAALAERPGLSVKLSALHPRYEPAQEERLRAELLPRMKALACAARDAWLPLTVDAEEADKLDLSFGLIGELLADPDVAGWNGLGLAVQAYDKRARDTIDWLAEIAGRTGRRIPVRLVKGAYWDSEIKRSQEQGLATYPVFTRKANTDVAWLAAARKLLSRPDCFYPQFATHNAFSAAAVAVLAEGVPFEFQRLYGMGGALYGRVIAIEGLSKPCRIYAPVGENRDLLAYLVRRLLENGANTSFVNRLADDAAPLAEIVADPVEKASGFAEKRHPAIPLPGDLFAPARRNSEGLPLWNPETRARLYGDIEGASTELAQAAPIVSGNILESNDVLDIRAPQNRRVLVGTCRPADQQAIEAALVAASEHHEAWDRLGGAQRATILERAVDLFEADRANLMGLMIREGGKTLGNAQADLREAVDFLYYYAAQARAQFEASSPLPGPTGERNELSLHGRGVFACISPWNFPLAIFTGQIAGALAAGNAVLAKPAEQTPLVAFRGIRLLHQAGVPAEVLHFLPGTGDSVGAALVADRRVSGVAFTGGTDTGLAINRALAAREGPLATLIAETGGLNAMIVDSSALVEQVTEDVLRSAFDSAGQRCSALRLLFVQDDVAPGMLEMIKGATRELKVGDPMDYATDVGPVIDEESKRDLEAHKTRMRRVARELVDLPLGPEHAHGSFVAPAIYQIDDARLLKREVFGPILHVVRFAGDRLDAVIEAINDSGYGLTLGIHSRIGATADYIASRAKVGNVYVNRNQIGAVVGAQPFGGERLSGTGPKAGGPHYLPRFAVERVRTSNVTAAGGNATLLNLAARE